MLAGDAERDRTITGKLGSRDQLHIRLPGWDRRAAKFTQMQPSIARTEEATVTIV